MTTLRVLLCATAAFIAGPVLSFTFSDGTTARCTARGAVVPETDLSQSAEPPTFTGRVVPEGNGYRILWNMTKLRALPAAMHDYLFFHECAHARLPTRDEIEANCVGLQDMRAAGKAGPEVQARIAAHYGPDSDYWARTLRCADGALPAAGATPPAAGATPPATGATPPAAGATPPAAGSAPPTAGSAPTSP
jgi:hypothetical protein